MDFEELNVSPEVVLPDGAQDISGAFDDATSGIAPNGDTASDIDDEGALEEQSADGQSDGHFVGGQSAEDNARFADYRRKAQLDEAKRELAQERAGKQRIEGVLNQLGYHGNIQDIADELDARDTNTPIDRVRAQREDNEKAQGLLATLKEENQVLRKIEENRTFAADLAEIRAIDKSVKSLGDLGDDFYRMRAAGVSNIAAYHAAMTTLAKPPSTGDLNTTTTKEKDFFTADEVDKMSQADVDKNYDIIRKSMSKWK